jgi:diguanylate cyclase (GGDEF)-like protein/PAS domain S-box-containing protein
MADTADRPRAGFHDDGRDKAAAALSGFADATAFALLIIDRNGIIRFVNKAAQLMFGYDRDEMVGRTLDLVIPSRLRGAHRAGVERVGGGQPSKLNGRTVEVAALRRDGSEFPIELTLCAWQGEDGISMGGIIRDISEKREREIRLHRLAHQDPLTGLPNRIRLYERLGAMLAAGEPVAVLLLAIDGLKKINDNLGHMTGDSLLQALAVRLPSALDADAFLARLGGDEFAVLLPGVADPQHALAAAAAVADAFDAAFNIGDHLLKLGVGIGVALGPGHGEDPEELMASADLALTQANRDANADFRMFEPAMRSAVAASRALKDQLLHAVEAGELVLYYQPQVDLRSGAIFGAEALLRWNHPRRGLLLPNKFLAVLESHSLALRVGCWILDEACRQAARWRAAGRPEFRVSVNLFAAQIDGGLADTVMETLRRHRLPPQAIEIEVTETIMLDHDERMLEPFRALRDHGVRIAFDDFGTGHASLSTLRGFPLTTLKIDRGFVRDLLSEPADAAIVQALLSMGRGMGLDVIAEGIETKEQEAVLRTMGCRLGQGFLYGKAVGPLDFASILAKNRPSGPPTRKVPKLG